MSIPIQVPEMGESVTEGIIARWLKQPGEPVSEDEPVVEVETDKITVEVPSPQAGVLKTQAVQEGDTVQVGDTLGEIEPGAAPAAAPEPKAPAATPEPKAAPAASPTAAPAPATGAPAMPAARAEAARRGVDVTQVSGTGRGGRVLKEDVARHAASPPAAARPAAPTGSAQPREERKPMTPLRRKVAERLVRAQQQAAMLTTFNEVDMSAVMAVRKRYKEAFLERHGVKLGFMSFFTKAVIEGLKAFPSVNAEIDGDQVIYKYHYDIGVAVGGGKGLVVPVLRDVDRKSFAQIEAEILDYAQRARSNKLQLSDLQGGTFTISNGGVYGSMLSTPILNPPQTGILGLHNIVERPVAVAGQVEIRPVMYLALTYDHRLVDGREAVQFLVTVKRCIEDPQRLLLEV